MTVSQISVFTESKPGHLAKTLELFQDAGINVRGYSVSDTGEYGIARFIVDSPEKAGDTLRRAGCAFTLTEVICLRLEDRPGELARVMRLLSECGDNVLYSYSMISTYIIISTQDSAHTEKMLEGQSVCLLHQSQLEDLYK